MDLRYVHPLSVYDNYHPKLKKHYQLATFLSQTPLPSTTSDDDIQDRDAVGASTENSTALIEQKPKRRP